MRKEDLLSTLSKIEPSDELKEKTKLKMMNAAMARKETKRPNFLVRYSTAICAASLAIVCAATFGVQKLAPHSYVAEISEHSNISKLDSISAPSHFTEDTPATFSARTRESEFEIFLSDITEDYRAIGVSGTLESKEVFTCNNASEYGIYGFTVLNIKIDDVFYSENEPFFGIKAGDTVSFVKYLYSDSQTASTMTEGENIRLYAYSGKDMVPFDGIAEKIGLENVFIIFE